PPAVGGARWSAAEPTAAERAWHASAVGHDPLAWFTTEQRKLVAVVVAAHAARHWRTTIRLADSMSGALAARAAWADWHTTHTLALDAAHRCGDRRAAAGLLRSLGDLAWQRRRLPEARVHYQQARLAAWEVADPREYARSLVSLAELSLDLGELEDAARLVDSALAVASTPRDTRGRYAALRVLSLLALERGEWDAAERSFAQCLELAGVLRDRRLEDFARRALRALRTGHLGGHSPAGPDESAPHRTAPSGVEVRPGVWRLHTPAIP
ncbi:transcriptional regulator, partial [Streptomyces sp. 796.1]